MSVIVWDGLTLAADRQTSIGQVPLRASKIRRLRNGYVAAWTGDAEIGILLQDWFENGGDAGNWPKTQVLDNFTSLVVAMRRGVCYWYESQPVPQRAQKRWAWGCGSGVALGALGMGATARKAVLVANRFNVHCGNGVEAFDL